MTSLTIANRKGLHARASAKIVETVEQFDAVAFVSKDGTEVCGDSIMGLMMLAAAFGEKISIRTDGPEADILMQELQNLIERKFDEGE